MRPIRFCGITNAMNDTIRLTQSVRVATPFQHIGQGQSVVWKTTLGKEYHENKQIVYVSGYKCNDSKTYYLDDDHSYYPVIL
jgi:hypothetical protein